MDNSGKLLGAQINREWFLYQEKEVFAEYRQKRLTIGLPNETERRENRVCLTPEAVAMMVDMGHTIMVQRGAGEAAHYHDREYADAGAQMLDTCEEVYTADIILKPTPVMQADVEMMHDRQVIMSPIELFELRKEAVVEMMQKKITAVGFDILKDENETYPVVQMMSEISGSSAIMIASEYLSNSREGKGILLGGVTGITPAEVVILGAGTLGEYAARTALALGAEVKVFDHSLERLQEQLKQAEGSRETQQRLYEQLASQLRETVEQSQESIRYLEQMGLPDTINNIQAAHQLICQNYDVYHEIHERRRDVSGDEQDELRQSMEEIPDSLDQEDMLLQS